jgi:ribose transport system permease protein
MDDRRLRSLVVGAGHQLAGWQRRFPLFQLLGLAMVCLLGVVSVDGFATPASVDAILVLSSFLGLAALGQTLVVLIGGFDLSIPAFILLGATMIVELAGADRWPFVAALALAVAVAFVLGSVNGLVCHFFHIQPLIVTLGMSAVVDGILQVWTGGTISGTVPSWLSTLASPSAKTLGLSIPPLPVLWLVFAVVVGVVLQRTIPGRWMYATGANMRAARLALVPVGMVWVGAFAASAVFSALTGMLLAGFAPGDTSIGDPYLFEGLAAVIVGGTAFGAKGDYWRTVLGALVLVVLTTVLVGHGLSEAAQQILYGTVILIVVVGYGRDRRLRDQL